MPSRYRTFQASSSPPEQVVESLTIIDPEEWDELHDRTWARAQSGVHNFVHPKADSCFMGLALENSGGPNGGKCLRVTTMKWASGTNATWGGTVVSLDGSPNLQGLDGNYAQLAIDTSDAGFTSYSIVSYDNTAKTVTLDSTPSGTSGQTWRIWNGLPAFWVLRKSVSGSGDSGSNATWGTTPVVSLNQAVDLSSTPNRISIDCSVGGVNAGWIHFDVNSADDGANTVTLDRMPCGDSGRPWRLVWGSDNTPNSEAMYYRWTSGESGWNGFQFWVKFATDYRKTQAAKDPATQTGSEKQNWVWGTYQSDTLGSQESDGWHFYFRPFFRHDLRNNGWILVRFREHPTFMRGVTQGYPNNPTIFFDNMSDCLQAFYLDSQDYFTDPEIEPPFDTLFGKIELIRVPDKGYGLSASWDSLSNGQDVFISLGETQEHAFTITNSSGVARDVKIVAVSFWLYANTVTIDGQAFGEGQITLQPGNTTGSMEIIRSSSGTAPRSYCGFRLIPVEELTDEANPSTVYPNWSDPYVENRTGLHGDCPYDAEDHGIHLHMRLA